MYILFVKFHVLPSTYYAMKPGEKVIMRGIVDRFYEEVRG